MSTTCNHKGPHTKEVGQSMMITAEIGMMCSETKECPQHGEGAGRGRSSLLSLRKEAYSCGQSLNTPTIAVQANVSITSHSPSKE